MYVTLTHPDGYEMLVNVGIAQVVKPWNRTSGPAGACVEYADSGIYVLESVEQVAELLSPADRLPGTLLESEVDPASEILHSQMGGTLAMLVGQMGAIVMASDRIARALELLVGTGHQADGRNDRIGRLCEVEEGISQSIREAGHVS